MQAGRTCSGWKQGRGGTRSKSPHELTAIVAPFMWRDWEESLVGHPDREFVAYITSGIQRGGFNYRHHSCRKVTRNMRSALEHPEEIRKYLRNECVEGRVLGPFNPQSLLQVQVSRFGVIPGVGG